MPRILILTLIFRPDNVSTAQIMTDLAMDLKAKGHDVFVLTTIPHYNDDVIALAEQPLRPYWGKLVQESDYRGIKVLHVWMPRKGKNIILRLAAWIGFHIISTIAGIFSRFKPDVILAPSPPLTIGINAWILGACFKAPFIYNIQEIYPDVAVNLGVLKNRLLINFFRILEKFVYAKADVLTVISEGMASRVCARVVSREKVRMIPNFVDTEDFHPLPKKNDFSVFHRLQDKFVVSYAGNMGKPQRLEILLAAADLLRNEAGIHFLMMGDGSERASLIELAERLQLMNITFLSYQPYSLMAKAYASADVSFVSQAAGTSNDGIPSKVYRIMACARPVIACTDEESDLARLVIKTNGGAVVPPSNAKALADTILTAFQQYDSWVAKGLDSRSSILQEYSRSAVTEKYHALVLELVSARNL